MRYAALLLIAAAAAAPAAERKLFVSTFDRLRVDGPFRVVVTTGRSPGGTITGSPAQLDGVEVRQEGATVFVRRTASRWDEQPRAAAGEPVMVTLATPALGAVTLIGPGAVSVTGLKARRVDLSIAGTGTIAVTGVEAAELNATSIGTGRVTLAGRTTKARFVVNGAGGVDAGKLDADELNVRLDGPGEVSARARFTANLVNTGLGRIAVAGPARCSVKADAGGPVTCGAGQAR